MTDETRDIELRFHADSQAKAVFAVKLARGFPSHREREADDGTEHSVRFAGGAERGEAFDRFVSLLKIVRGWRGTGLQVDGERAPGSLVDRLMAVGECYQRQRGSGNRFHYCNGFDPRHAPTYFGCRQLTCVNRIVPRNGEQRHSDRAWYRHGEMCSNSFRVDKQRVLTMLADEATEKLVAACPVYSRDAVAREVEGLPNEIFPERDTRWVREVLPDGTSGVRMQSMRSAGDDDAERPLSGRTVRVRLVTDRSDARDVPDTRFADVGGQDEAIEAVRDRIELPLRHPEYFDRVGVPLRAGIILYGPPGTGKTLLARAVAGECDAHLEIVSGPEILSRWVGRTEESLRSIFNRARDLAPSIVLLDELDAISPSRDQSTHNHEVTLVSQLLALLDGIYDRGNVAVMGTTNRLDAIDSALRRAGRLEWAIPMEKPDVAGRRAVFRCHLAKMAVSDAVSVSWLAELTDGATGADIARICHEAGLSAIKSAVRDGMVEPGDVRIEPGDFASVLRRLDMRTTSLPSHMSS